MYSKFAECSLSYAKVVQNFGIRKTFHTFVRNIVNNEEGNYIHFIIFSIRLDQYSVMPSDTIPYNLSASQIRGKGGLAHHNRRYRLATLLRPHRIGHCKAEEGTDGHPR